MLIKLDAEYPLEEIHSYLLEVDYQLEGKYVPGTYFIPESFPETYITSIDIIEKDGQDYQVNDQDAIEEIKWLKHRYEENIIDEIESKLSLEDYTSKR